MDRDQRANASKPGRFESNTVKLGLICAPEIPTTIGHRLADELPGLLARRIGADVAWDVSVIVDPLTGSERDAPEILDSCYERLRQESWDLAIPRCAHNLLRRLHERCSTAFSAIANAGESEKSVPQKHQSGEVSHSGEHCDNIIYSTRRR